MLFLSLWYFFLLHQIFSCSDTTEKKNAPIPGLLLPFTDHFGIFCSISVEYNLKFEKDKQLEQNFCILIYYFSSVAGIRHFK